MLYNQRPLVMRFALSASPAAGLVITAAAATDDDFVWRGPGGSFIGKAPALGNFTVGAYYLRSRQWSAITVLNWNTKKLTGNLASMINPVSSRLTGLRYLYLYINQLSGLFSDVTLPTGLTYLHLYNNQLAGLLSDATLPTGLTYLHLAINQLAGLLSDVTFPSGLTYLNLAVNQLVGLLSDVTFPSGLTFLNLHDNQLSGLLSDVTLPTGLTQLNLGANQLSGSFGDVTIPVNLATTYVYNNQLTYPSAGKCLSTVTKNSARWYMQSNGMVQGHVDNVLADLVTSGTTGGTLNIAGSNAAPSAAGLANKTTLEGRGWTVTV